jgi:hypothetical protein
VTLMTAKKFMAGGLKGRIELTRKTWNLDAGERRRLAVKLPSGAKRLARKSRLALRAVAVSDGAGERAGKLTLRYR